LARTTNIATVPGPIGGRADAVITAASLHPSYPETAVDMTTTEHSKGASRPWSYQGHGAPNK